MSRAQRLAALLRDARGAAAVEFAILAPIIFGLMLGVLQLGLHMHNFNAIRAVATDTARYTIVEYQKGNKLTDEQIKTKAIALAVNAPYLLDSENLTVNMTRPVTDVVGTIRMNVEVIYTPTGMLSVLGVGSPTMKFNRPIYVAI